MQRVKLARHERKHPPRNKSKSFGFVSPEERAHQREVRKRRKLGIKHDLAVPADKSFTICLTRIVNAPRDLMKWRANMNRYWEAVLADHGQKK